MGEKDRMFQPIPIALEVLETSKHDPPIGPFPRNAWVHPVAPKDEFDRVCYRIWKQAQDLPEGLKPQNGNLTSKTERTQEKSNNTNVRSVHGRSTDDDISSMVQQEYMNLFIENLSECFSYMSIKECDRQAIDEIAETLKIENAIKSLLTKGNSNKNLPLKTKKCYIQDRSSSQVRMSGLLDKEDTCSIECTKMEACKLPAHFPKKSTETKMVENHRKNILTICSKEGSTCETASKADNNQQKDFAKLCAKGYHHSDSERPTQAVAPVTGNEANNRSMKQAGPRFMPPTSSVPEVPANQPYMSNFPSVPFFCMPHGMHYGQFQQVTRHVLPLPFHPMMYYMHYMHLTYQMRGFPKPSPGIRGYPRIMAGDGPQYPLLLPHRFNAPISRMSINSQNLSSSGNRMQPF